MGSADFWAIESPHSFILPGHRKLVLSLGFTPDSRRLVSAGEEGAFVWPVSPDVEPRPRSFETQGWSYAHPLPFKPDGRAFLDCYFGATLQPIDGTEATWLQPRPVREISTGCAIDPAGRRAATAAELARPPGRKHLRVFDLESGDLLRQWPLVPPEEEDVGNVGAVYVAAFSGERILTAGHGGVRSFDMRSGEESRLWRAPMALMAASRDGRRVLVVGGESTGDIDMGKSPTTLALLEVDGGETPITTHGSSVSSVAIGPEGRVIATGDTAGIIRVGNADGSEPHLLMGHTAGVERVVISPDLRWVASKSGTEVRLWPMPDLSKPPLHTLPYDELMSKLRSFTNLEVVEDEASSTGYRLEVGPFPGWKDVPSW
jgi:WD40 repeat protein